METIFSFIDHIASLLTVLAFPSVLVGVGLFELWSRGKHQMTAVRRIIMVALLVFGGLAYVVDVSDRMGWIRPKEPKLKRVKTTLRLQFYGDRRLPTEIIPSENIFHWYAMYSPSMFFSIKDAATGENVTPSGSPQINPTWTIVIVFDEPTKFRQMTVSFSNPSIMPPIDLTDSTSRSAVFHFQENIPAGVMEFSAKLD